ncbi:MAG: DUF2459 domain-containing protein [Pseudomonadota bacterium]
MEFLKRWISRILVVFLVAGIGLWLSLVPGDPKIFPAKGNPHPVWVLDHGWHSGIVIGQAELRAAAFRISREDPAAGERLRWLTTRFPAGEWLEIGWGDADFYRATPTLGDVDPILGLKALVAPTDSAMHVVPGWGPPSETFPGSPNVQMPLSTAGFDRLALKLAESIPEPAPLGQIGPSLYGTGAFYPAKPDYHAFRTCNHWISGLLRAAGVPSSPIPGTFSWTLQAELRLRFHGINLPQF